MRYYLTNMVRPKHDPPRALLKVCTVKLTEAAEQTLQSLSQDISDALGWTVSKSALMRALLLYVERQLTAWRGEALLPLIEEEIVQGRVWGKKR